jgi:two-component system cell cycle sensor histidine kinase/response regulator CckA
MNVPTILLVENDPHGVALTQRAIRKTELSVSLQLVSDGEQAVAYLNGENEYADRARYPLPELILLDMQLPGKSGLEVVAWLRKQPQLATLRVVMLTAPRQPDAIRDTFGLGANTYLLKPVTPEALSDLLCTLALPLDKAPRILLIGDDPELRLLAMRELTRGLAGVQVEPVSTAEEVLPALERGGYDLVITDDQLPWANGLTIVRMVKAYWPTCPVIMFTATGSEQVAAEAMRAGLDDYVLKNPAQLVRLSGAVRLLLGRERLRQARKRAEDALRASEDRYRDLVEHSQDLLCTHDLQGRILSANPWAAKVLGYEPEAILQMNLSDFLAPETRGEFDAYLARIRKRGTAKGLLIVQTATGERRVWEYHNSLRTEGVAEPIVRGMARDITERRRAEEALAAERLLLRTLIDHLPDAIYVKDDAYRKTLANPADVRNMGAASEAEVLGKTDFDFFPHDLAAAFYADDESVIQSGRPVLDREEMITLPDGTRGWQTTSKVPLRDRAGQVVGLVGIGHDITERKQAEKELQRAERRYRTLFEDAPVMYVITRSQEGCPVVADCNGLFLSTLGYSRDQVLERPLADFYTPQSRAELLPGGGYHRALNDSFVVEERQLVTRDGQVIDTLLHASPETDAAGRVCGTRAAYVDITLRKRAEEALERRVTQLALLNDVGSRITAVLDLDALLNQAAHLIQINFGYHHVGIFTTNSSQGELVMRARAGQFAAFYPPDHQVKMEQGLVGWVGYHGQTALANDVSREPRYINPSPDLIPTRSELSVPLRVEQEIVGVLDVQSPEIDAFDQDDVQVMETLASQLAAAIHNARLYRAVQRELGERMRAEAELRRLKEFNESIVQSMAEGIVVEDAEGTLTFVNPAAAAMLGYAAQDLVGQHWTRIIPPDQQPIVRAANERRVHGQADHYEVDLVRRDGTRLPVLVSASPRLAPGDGRFSGTLAVLADLSELKRLEEQFRQTQKMEAVGRLAGGIAHDFNNLLTVIHLSTRLLERQLYPEDPLWQHVQRIQDAGQRAANLTKQLLAFSRQEIVEPHLLDLNEVVGDLDKMLRRLIREDVELTTLLADDLWPVKIDPTQVEQVVVNLAVNARDAMPTGGKLTIETVNVVLDEAYAARHPEVEPGEYVMLAASDTGTGMSDEVKAHIFEPFFTTKEKGKGTGLGLATVFGIVKQNGGHIWVYSEPGQGTSFKIYLPHVAEGARSPSDLPTDGVAPSARGSETLLLVEDETGIRELVGDVLADQGYRILVAQDGVEALHLAREHEGPIHLLLTDVIMPRMSGKALADQLRSSHPEMSVVYTSGYTDDAIVHHGVLDKGTHFLSKPFELEALARKVRDVLDGAVRPLAGVEKEETP